MTTGSAAGRLRSGPRCGSPATRAEVDFTGTDPQTTGGVNANYAITLSAASTRSAA